MKLYQIALWSSAFTCNEKDPNKPHYDRLRESFLDFRKRTETLVNFIPSDMREYTVHTISHLDALWEMADLIVGKKFLLNPAEAYVLGGAILLHDAGMTVAAYPGGIDELKKTAEWNEARDSARSSAINAGLIRSDAEIEKTATIDALRILHAEKAQQLATQYWINPETKKQESLIQISEFQEFYGPTIGKIAYSHHWSHSRLLSEFHVPLGAFDDMPNSWQVDVLKVALLLRCADAAHIDHRRAPRFLHTLTLPSGISAEHWKFQDRLSKPTVRNDDTIVYSSTKPFEIQDADAWQICWDTIQMIDRELATAANILEERKHQPFALKKVLGARSPLSLAETIKTNGWRPVPTDFKVSDVPSVARSLGGRALYSVPYAPLRELLQNAADAIDARASIDRSFRASDGRITITIKNINISDKIRLSVSDNGIGMSERVLTEALLDFGRSFWRSDLARQEFEELPSKFKTARGRYGIGFFSVFMWSHEVTVHSRRYDSALADGRTLEFRAGLGRRPICRVSSNEEKSTATYTNISLVIPKNIKISDGVARSRHYLRSRPPQFIEFDSDGIEQTIRQLVFALKIPVYLDRNGVEKLINKPDWATCSPSEFAEYLRLFYRNQQARYFRFEKTPLQLSNEIAAQNRVLIVPSTSNEYYEDDDDCLAHENGIYVSEITCPGFIGFVEKKSITAARERTAERELLIPATYLQTVAASLFDECIDVAEKIALQKSLAKHDAYDRNQPICIFQRKICSIEQVRTILSTDIAPVAIKVAMFLDAGPDIVSTENPKIDALIGYNTEIDQLFFIPQFFIGELSSQKFKTGQGTFSEFYNTLENPSHSFEECPLSKVLFEIFGSKTVVAQGNVNIPERERSTQDVNFFITIPSRP